MEEFMVFFTTFLGSQTYIKNAYLRCAGSVVVG
jgi:hypothetical protein